MASTFTEAVQNSQQGIPLLSPAEANDALAADANFEDIFLGEGGHRSMA